MKNENARAINFCLGIINKNYDQTVDIVKYLSVFVNDEYFSNDIFKVVSSYLKNEDNKIYQWVWCWLLNLYIKTDISDFVDKELLKRIFMDENHNSLTRATALLAYAKHLHDFELMFLKKTYYEAKCILFKRAILASASKLPSTVTKELFNIEDDDELDIIVLKNTCQLTNIKSK